MDDLYEDLIKNANSLKGSEEKDFNSIDGYLSGNIERIKVSSIDDFFQFCRIGKDTLVHKAEKDLWRLTVDGKGQFVIERLFDPDTKKPLRI